MDDCEVAVVEVMVAVVIVVVIVVMLMPCGFSTDDSGGFGGVLVCRGRGDNW